MKHARSDYDRIQDPENRIPQDEPVFLLRAQDTIAPLVVTIWADIAEKFGARQDIVVLARYHVIRMRQWQKEHGCKVPDIPDKNSSYSIESNKI